jgi:hypothetical protein
VEQGRPVPVSVEEGIDHVFKRQRDQRVRGHGCASPDGQEAGARHEQVIHVLRQSGLEGAIRRFQDAEVMQACTLSSPTVPKDPQEDAHLHWGKIDPVEVMERRPHLVL